MLSGCGNIVETMRTTLRKKCARTITGIVAFTKNSVQSWTTTHLPHHPYTSLSPRLSTLPFRLLSSVKYVVLPIIHSTYYKYYQFDRKEI